MNTWYHFLCHDVKIWEKDKYIINLIACLANCYKQIYINNQGAYRQFRKKGSYVALRRKNSNRLLSEIKMPGGV